MGKYKIVVDTNIFVSSFLGSKNAKLIVRDIFAGQHQIVMSHTFILMNLTSSLVF